MNVDVLIIGAGPTGLMLANQLARSGVRVQIIDRHSGPAQETRAIGFASWRSAKGHPRCGRLSSRMHDAFDSTSFDASRACQRARPPAHDEPLGGSASATPTMVSDGS